MAWHTGYKDLTFNKDPIKCGNIHLGNTLGTWKHVGNALGT